MKQVKNTDKKPTVIRVDKNLDKYLQQGLFKDKVDKANHVLKTVGLPKFPTSRDLWGLWDHKILRSSHRSLRDSRLLLFPIHFQQGHTLLWKSKRNCCFPLLNIQSRGPAKLFKQPWLFQLFYLRSGRPFRGAHLFPDFVGIAVVAIDPVLC